MPFLTVNNSGFAICEQKLTLELMQQLVGNPEEIAFIDAVYHQFSDKSIVILVDDDGIRKRLPLVAITKKKIKLVGQLVIVHVIGSDFFHLTQKQVSIVKRELTLVLPLTKLGD